jgi:arylsulfatase A-like enzyme
MEKQPNIILLVMDSVRVTNLSCYGYERPTTPNIDALARQGTLYEQAISVGCWTLPVHASLFTGLYPMSHGVTVSKDALPEGFPTLGRRLREVGYQTACFSNNAYISSATGLDQGFDTVEDVWRVTHPRGTERTKMSKRIKQLERRGVWTKPIVAVLRRAMRIRSFLKHRRSQKDSGARLTNEKIQTWLHDSRRSGTPFFLFVNYMECHERYSPPHPYDRRFMPERFSPWRVAQVSPNKTEVLAGSHKRRADDIEIMRALYDGALNYLDEKIAELVRSLESLGLLEDTVVIVTSDHGDSLGEHDHLGHRLALYEQLVHVPLIVRYPAWFLPGLRVEQQVQLADLFPTILDLAGADTADASANGFHSLLEPPPPEVRPFTVAENTAPTSLDNVMARMIRTGQYKYIWKSNHQHELYDLSRDPNETANLVAVEPEVARLLVERLEAWERSLEDKRIETRQAEYDEATLQRLRGLGYVA